MGERTVLQCKVYVLYMNVIHGIRLYESYM